MKANTQKKRLIKLFFSFVYYVLKKPSDSNLSQITVFLELSSNYKMSLPSRFYISPGRGSKPWAKSIPKRPNAGIKIRIPKPADLFRFKRIKVSKIVIRITSF